MTILTGKAHYKGRQLTATSYFTGATPEEVREKAEKAAKWWGWQLMYIAITPAGEVQHAS